MDASARTDDGPVHSSGPAAGPPVTRRGLCRLARPRLLHPQITPRFRFQEATVLLVTSGELQLGPDPAHRFAGAPALLLVPARTTADLVKVPGGPQGSFRSVFLELCAPLLTSAAREHPNLLGGPVDSWSGPARRVHLDDDVLGSLEHAAASVEDEATSDARVQHRLLDLLLALAERGHAFPPVAEVTTADRVRQLVSDAPGQRWTASSAGQALAVSEATLRRHLAREGTGFEELVVDVRMHHAVMLLQTTGWSLSHIAEACGYLSRSRFSERFRQRFGTSPVAVR